MDGAVESGHFGHATANKTSGNALHRSTRARTVPECVAALEVLAHVVTN